MLGNAYKIVKYYILASKKITPEEMCQVSKSLQMIEVTLCDHTRVFLSSWFNLNLAVKRQFIHHLNSNSIGHSRSKD